MNYFKKRLAAKEQEKQEGPAPIQGALSGPIGQTQGFSGQQGFADQQQGAGGFAAQKKSFSQTQQGDNPNRQIMRDQYGWKMTNDQFENLEKDTGRFNTEVNKYKAAATKKIGQYKTENEAKIAAEQERYNTTSAQLTAESKKTQAELAAAKKKLGALPSQSKVFSDWYNKDKMQIGVIDESGKLQCTYYVPRTMAKQGIIGHMDGAWDTTTKNPGQRFLVSVKQGGRTRGQEVHDMLRNDYSRDNVQKEFWKTPEIQGGYRKTVQNWNTANKQLSAAESKYQQNLQASKSNLSQFQTNIARSRQNLAHSIKSANLSRDTEIAKVKSSRQGKLDAAKSAYQKRSNMRKTAYRNLAKMSGSAGAKGANNE